MADKTFETALAELADVATEITKQLYSAAQEQGADAVNLILNTYRFEGVMSLVTGGALLTISAIAAGKIAPVMMGKYVQQNIKYHEVHACRDAGDRFVAAAITLWIVSLLMSLWGAVKVFNIWNWAAAIEPKFYLAHMFLNKVGL